MYGVMLQFLYNQDATTNLDTSSIEPMIIIGITAAANIAVNPTIA
jgi:hypothetical protein